METQKKIFKKTIGFQQLIQETWKHTLSYFEEWPIKEVRLKCLERMKEGGLYNDTADWAEACITSFLEQNDDLKDEVLSWYIFTAKHDIAARALEFALSLRKGYPRLWNSELSKLVAGKLLKDGEIRLYPLVPSLHAFLDELLDEPAKKFSDGYSDSDWYCTERAFRIIIAAEDFSFLPKIEELILLHQQGTIKPYRYASPYQKDLNLAMLKATKRLLLKAQKEHITNKKTQ